MSESEIKLLNAKLRSHMRVRKLDQPLDIREYGWLDKKFLYETHTMALIDKPPGMSKEEAFHKLGMTHPWEPDFPSWPKMRVQTLVLEACQGCNLRCRYCFVAHEYAGGLTDKLGTKMSFEVAKEAIDTIIDPETKRPSTGFFGGEPLVNWPLMEKVTHYMEEKFKGRQVGLHVTTNGTLITPEIAKFLGKHNYSMIVSLDGDEKTHNFNRPMAGGKNSWEATMRGLELIRKHAPRTSPRITLRATFPWYDRQSTLLDKVRFLNELCDKGYAGWVSVEPAVLTEGCAKTPASDVMTFTVKRVKELIPEYEEASQWFVEQVKAGKTPRFHHFSKVVERILYACHATTECGAGRGYMSAGGDRKLYACHREQNSFLGMLGEDISEAQKIWLDNTLQVKETCPKCPIRYICGGGCREEAIGYFGMEGHGKIPPEEAIHKAYPVMCAFKNIFVRSSFYIISQAGRMALSKIIKNPMAGKMRQAGHQTRGGPHLWSPPAGGVIMSNRLPIKKGKQHVCDCGKDRCERK